MKQECAVCDLNLQQKTPIIYRIQSGMVWEGKLCCEELDLHADICNLGSCFPATYYMSFLQSQGTQGQNMITKRLSHTII